MVDELMLAAFVVAVLLVFFWSVFRSVRRHRREQENIEVLKALAQQKLTELEKRTKRDQARRAQYKREMSARSMDRFNGLMVSPDPTYEEWLADRGHVNGSRS